MDNHTTIGDALSLGRLRAALAKVAHLPDDTDVQRVEDDANEPDSYADITNLRVAYWDGERQCEPGDEDACLAVFVW